MAQTQADSTVSHAPPVSTLRPESVPTGDTPARNRGGRPPKQQPAQSESQAGPAAGEEGGADPDFFEHLKTYPAAEWKENLFMHLYRTAPFLNLGRRGEWTVEKYVRPIDAQHILENHGSGGYKILLDRWDPVTNRTVILRTHFFMLINMKYPPRVPLGAWIDKPENSEWLWAKAALQEQMAAPASARPQSADSQAAALFKEAVSAAKELMPDVSKGEQTTLTQAVIGMMREANNPKAMLELVNTIVGKKDGGEGTAILTMVTNQLQSMQTELAAERAFSRDLLKQISTPAAAAAQPAKKSLKEEVLELHEVMEVLGMKTSAGGGGSKGPDWAGIALELGKEILKTGGAITTAIIAKRGQQPGQQQQQRGAQQAQRPNQPQPTQPQQIAPADAAQQPQAPAPGEESMNMVQIIANQFAGLFDEITPFLVDMFTKDYSGMEFREWFKETYGTATYSALRSMDKRTIMEVLDLRRIQAPPHVQELMQRFGPPEKVQLFLDEFLSDTEIPDEEDEDEAPPAPIAATPRETDQEF